MIKSDCKYVSSGIAPGMLLCSQKGTFSCSNCEYYETLKLDDWKKEAKIKVIQANYLKMQFEGKMYNGATSEKQEMEENLEEHKKLKETKPCK